MGEGSLPRMVGDAPLHRLHCCNQQRGKLPARYPLPLVCHSTLHWVTSIDHQPLIELCRTSLSTKISSMTTIRKKRKYSHSTINSLEYFDDNQKYKNVLWFIYLMIDFKAGKAIEPKCLLEFFDQVSVIQTNQLCITVPRMIQDVLAFQNRWNTLSNVALETRSTREGVFAEVVSLTNTKQWLPVCLDRYQNINMKVINLNVKQYPMF